MALLDYKCLLQKRIVRLIDNQDRLAHTDPIFTKYKILKIEQIIHLQKLVFMFKYLHGTLSSIFQN